jgi:hypothetical protein
MTDGTGGQLGEGNLGGQPGQDSRDMIARTEQPGQISLNKSVNTGQSMKVNLDDNTK